MSADDFLMENGVYKYDVTKIPAAHQKCMRDFVTAVYTGSHDVIVIDNTNLTVVDMSPYVSVAFAFDFAPEVVTIRVSDADVEKCAEKLRGDYIFSWKPHPANLVGRFDEGSIRRYIRRTIKTAEKHDCVLEMILKDTNTCEHHPERFDRWTQIAREEVNRVRR